MSSSITKIISTHQKTIVQPCLWILLLIASSVIAETKSNVPPDAVASDPIALNWMKGSPPPENKIIRFADGKYFNYPQMRWSVCNFRQLMPTMTVNKGMGAYGSILQKMDKQIDALSFLPMNSSNTMTWEASLNKNYTDGIIVLHKGQVVYERYFGCLDENGLHAAMSMTKSLVGLLGETLVAENTLDETALVGKLVPELKDSAFGDATVRQVLDMTTALDYSEDYADPKAGVWIYSAAGSPLPKPADYKGPRSYFEYLVTVKKKGIHGDTFGYKTINTDVLGWVLSRATGKNVAELLSDRIWSQIGAARDAYFTVDSIGTPFAGGGLNANLRDFARIGQLLLGEGIINGKRIIPAKAVTRIREGGDQKVFTKANYSLLPDWSYRSMWWVTHNEHKAFMARGVHGQSLYIDPTAQMVIARFASHPTAGNAANDPTTLPAYHALAKYLIKK